MRIYIFRHIFVAYIQVRRLCLQERAVWVQRSGIQKDVVRTGNELSYLDLTNAGPADLEKKIYTVSSYFRDDNIFQKEVLGGLM